MFFKRSDNLPPVLTSYDLLKSFTLVFMLVDHVGAFFLLDEEWWRILGRLGFPAWFFLAGYAKSRDVSPNLWAGAFLLVVGNFVFGQYMLPANALVSYICVRVFMTPFFAKTFSNWETLLYVVLGLSMLSIPTNFMFEYGTMAFLLAVLGYGVRNKDNLASGRYGLGLLAVFVALIVGVLQAAFFAVNQEQVIVCVLEMAVSVFVLYHFRSMEFPQLTARLPAAVGAVIRFCGRYTLEIYTFHLLLIKAYLLYAHGDLYHWFEPTMFPHLPEIEMPASPAT